MVRPQHRPLQAVTKRGMPGSGPAGRMGRATPRLLCLSGREHQDTQCVCGMANLGRLRQDMGRKVSLAQTLLSGMVKTESCDSVISP